MSGQALDVVTIGDNSKLVSEYKKRYKKHPLPPRQNFKPQHEPVHQDGVIDDVSTSRKDYVEHKVGRTAPIKPVDSNLNPEGEIDLTSSYAQEYPGKRGERVRPIKRQDQRTDLGKFEGEPSYKNDYPKWKLPERQVREREKWAAPEDEFDGQTTSRSDYPKHQISPRETYKPDNAYVKPEAPFDERTGYRETYIAHKIPKKETREKEAFVPPTTKFNATTTAGESFQAKHQPKRESYKPNQQALHTEEPFDGSTTLSRDFPPHKVKPRQRQEREEYKPPEGKMAMDTTNQVNFTKPKHSKREPVQKPSSSKILRGEGQFEGSTNYQKDYPIHKISPREPIKNQSNWAPPEDQFDGDTTASLDYQQHALSQRESYRPSNHYVPSEEPFDDRTGYKDTYQAHKIPRREAKPEPQYAPPTTKFDDRTTVGDSYQGGYAPKMKSFKPENEPLHTDTPFDGTTTSKKDFPQHKVGRRVGREPQKYEQPVGNMDLHTTNELNFTNHPRVQREPIIKPSSSQALRGDGKFAASTHYSEDFTGRKGEKRESMKERATWAPPEEKFTAETTVSMAYQKHKITPRENYKPPNVYSVPDEPFNDNTGYKETYKAHKISPREQKPKEQYAPPTTKFDDRTTVRDSYQGGYAPKMKSFKPENEPLHTDTPFDGTTTSKKDFPQHKVGRRVGREPQKYEQPVGNMDLHTTNELNFTNHPRVQREPIIKPSSSQALRGDGKFAASTHYNEDFAGRKGEKRESMKERATWAPPEEKFTAETTVSMAYQKHKITPRESCRPPNTFVQSEQPFEGRTENMDTFKAHKITPREAKQKEEYLPPTTKLDTRTTFSDNFLGQYAPKRESFRPDNSYQQSDVPFDGDTTSRSEFPLHKTERRAVREVAPYRPPSGHMDLTTTNKTTFMTHGRVERSPAKRPRSSDVMKGQGPFNATSHYNNDFMGHKTGPRERVIRDQAYVPPVEKMEVSTTNQQDFTTKQISPRETYKPAANVMKSDVPFDDRTENKDAFVKHRPSPRVAKEKVEYTPSLAPFQSSTTNRLDFAGAVAPKQKSFKPDQTPFQSDAPFESSTTNSSSFVKHAIERRRGREPAPYVPPEGAMDMRTVNQEHFVEHKRQERVAVKRQESSHALTNDGQFDARTNYGSTFVKPAKVEQPQRRPKEEYTPRTERFEGVSTSRAEFQGLKAPKATSFKPVPTVSASYDQLAGQPAQSLERGQWSSPINVNYAIEATA